MSTALLCVGTEPPQTAPIGLDGWRAQRAPTIAEATPLLQRQGFDAVLIRLGPALAFDQLLRWQALSQAVLDAAVVVVVAAADLPLAPALIERGVQDVLADAGDAELARSLSLAVRRKAIEQQARRACATDLATGLPDHVQLREHMSHLLALREREPAPMALLVLRIEGLVPIAATLGTETANVLRRKAAVRLRAGLRASDVVAALGADTLAVLLAWIDAPGDAEHVAAKLVDALGQPYQVAGQPLAVAVAVGAAAFPHDGADADELLRLALGQAAAAPARGRAARSAANDG